MCGDPERDDPKGPLSLLNPYTFVKLHRGHDILAFFGSKRRRKGESDDRIRSLKAVMLLDFLKCIKITLVFCFPY